MTVTRIDGSRRGRVPPEIRALDDLYRLHSGSAGHAKHQLELEGWQVDCGRAPKQTVGLGEVADALSDMIDLADAWASCGPEGYTPEERRRRNRANRVLMRLYRRIETERRAA